MNLLQMTEICTELCKGGHIEEALQTSANVKLGPMQQVMCGRESRRGRRKTIYDIWWTLSLENVDA